MTNEQQQKQKHILLLSLLIGFALRIFQLDRQSLWFDDIITVHLARMPIIAGLDGLIGQGIQLTPLFHWMVKAWMILGDSEWVLRFLPVCISLMTIPLMFHLGRAYGSSSVGLLAAVIFAINPYQIWYAHELRIYSLLTFAAVGAMLTFQRMLKGAGAANTIAFIIFNALGFASHHFMFLLPTIQFIFFLRYFRRYYAHFRKWMLINIISGSVLLPWFGYIFYRGQFNFGIGWIPKPTLLDLPYTIWNFTLGYREDPPLLLTGAFTLILAILIWGFFSVRSLRPYHFLLRIWLIFPLIIVWLFSQGGSSSFYVDRYFLVVAPVVTLLIAFGIQSLPSPWLKTSVAGLVVLATLYGTNQILFNADYFMRDDWRLLAKTLRQEAQPQDGLVTCTDGYRLSLNYYEPGEIFDQQANAGQIYYVYPAQFDFEIVASQYERLWVAAANPRQPQHHIGFSYPLSPDPAHLSSDTRRWVTDHPPKVVAVAGLTALAYPVGDMPDMNELVEWICSAT